MNKKLIYGLCAASFLMTACDYNEDNFPGFDQEPLTDVVYYEGEFTGKYPTGRCVVMHDAPSFLFITDINRFIFFKLR